MRAKTGLVMLSGFLLTAVTAYAETKSQPAIQAFNQGVQRVNASKFNEAISFFDQAIERDEKFAEAYYARAVCKRNTQNLEGALMDLNRATQLKPDYLDAYALRGSLLYEQERWGPAYQDFNYILQQQPRDASALLGRGLTLLRQDKLNAARRDLALFVKLKPQDPLAPKLRKFLASFSEVAASSEEATSRVPSATRRPPSAASQELARDLFLNSRKMADTYEQKVLRGEKADASGDIHSHPTLPRGEPPK